MNFIYNDNTLNNNKINRIIENNKENIKNVRKNFGIITIEGNLYFVKTINKKMAPTLITNPNNDKEIDPTKQVVNFLADNKKYILLFVNIHIICQKEHNDYYIMDHIKYGDFTNMLPILNSRWKFTLLMQSLSSIFILNHKIKLFHNDLYYDGVIRNVMVDHVEKPYSFDLNINNVIIALNIKKFCVKMIDFGRCSNKQAFRTLEYHNKHFFNIKYISEPLIFTYFFFKTFGFDEFDMINRIGLDLGNESKTLLEFDSKFILKMYNRYKKYII